MVSQLLASVKDLHLLRDSFSLKCKKSEITEISTLISPFFKLFDDGKSNSNTPKIFALTLHILEIQQRHHTCQKLAECLVSTPKQAPNDPDNVRIPLVSRRV